MVLMPGHLWGLQSRSPQGRSHARTVPEEGILVVISVKEEDLGEVLSEAGAPPETSATTRVGDIEVGVPATLAGKPVILDGEEIRGRVGGATEDVDPTPAFFIRLILRVLWRRVLR